MGGRLVSERLSLSVLRLADGERQLPCGDDYGKYVVRPDSGSAIHCTVSLSMLYHPERILICRKDTKHVFRQLLILILNLEVVLSPARFRLLRYSEMRKIVDAQGSMEITSWISYWRGCGSVIGAVVDLSMGKVTESSTGQTSLATDNIDEGIAARYTVSIPYD
jgi:hypothetical protein